MEEKIYELIGVNLYRRFVIKVKNKYDQWRGKTDTENYFLREYTKDGLIFLKEQFVKNAKIHGLGVVLGIFVLGADISLWLKVLFGLVAVHNLYCVLIQRYNILRINKVLARKAVK